MKRPVAANAATGRSLIRASVLVVVHPLADDADDDGEEQESGADEQNGAVEIHEWLLVGDRQAGVRTMPLEFNAHRAHCLHGCRAVLREETAGGESDPRRSEDGTGGAGRSLGKRQHAAEVTRMGNTGHAGWRDDKGNVRVMDARADAGRHAVRGMGRCRRPALPLLAAGLAEGSRKGGDRRKRTRLHGGQGIASQARQGRMASAGDEQQDGNGRADAACHPESWSRPHDSRLFPLLTVSPQGQHCLFLYFQRYRPRAALSTTVCPVRERLRARRVV